MNPNAINIDDAYSNPDDLRRWSMTLPRAPRSVRCYAETKARAMGYRLAGDIARALRLEDQCDVFYQSIPNSWRW